MDAPLNELDSVGQSPLHYAVCHAFAKDLVPMLVEAGCQVDVQRRGDLWTPLHLAVMLGCDWHVLRALVVQGEADVELRDSRSMSPIDVAFKYRRFQVVDFLMRWREHSPNACYPYKYV